MARVHWASRFGFIMVAAGSAVGLGNIWKFPYITGKYGGSAFVFVYLLAIAVTGMPVFLAELYIGQASQKNVVDAFETLRGRKTLWSCAGWLGLFTGFLILGFYSVVGGWVLEYLWHSLINGFVGHTPEQIEGHLSELMASPGRLIFWHCLFMAVTVAIVLGGVKDGIERWNKIMMPGLFLLLILLLVRVVFLPGFVPALEFLFKPDFSKLSAEGALEAMGHSFFTLSLGLGSMVTYGSYLGRQTRLPSVAFTIIALDTGIALLAGVVTLAAVFSFGLEPQAGPALMFKTLPNLFAKLAGAYWISIAFFLLVTFAALTSSISLLEPVVTYCVDAKKTRRTPTAILAGCVSLVIGISAALSLNSLGHFLIGKDNLFDFLNKLTTNIMLPLGGMLICLFYGWVLGPKAIEATLQLKKKSRWAAWALLWVSRIVTPIAVAAVLINGIVHW